jgi:hypothetical protein
VTIVAVQDLASAFPDGSPPPTLRYFRNGIAPPAPGGRALANQINSLLGRRLRPLCQYANVYGLHADFDSASTSDLTCHRFAFRTGPVTTSLRWQVAALPYLGSPSAADVTIYLALTPGLTGGGTATNTTLSIPHATATNLTADDLIWLTYEIAVAPDSFYRIEIHRSNLARMVSTSVFEVLQLSLDTATYGIVPDPTTYYENAPITQQQTEALILAADKIWRRGHPLGWWSADIPGDERTRTSATAANLWDQTVAAPTGTSPGWPVSVPYAGSLDSADVPVMFWAYAECVGGTGTVTFRDQNDVVLGTINPVGAATWYAVRGNLTDNTAGAQTTKVDVFFAGDATNACNVYAAGVFMDAADDSVISGGTSTVGFLSSSNYSTWAQSRGRPFAGAPYFSASAIRRTPF